MILNYCSIVFCSITHKASYSKCFNDIGIDISNNFHPGNRCLANNNLNKKTLAKHVNAVNNKLEEGQHSLRKNKSFLKLFTHILFIVLNLA